MALARAMARKRRTKKKAADTDDLSLGKAKMIGSVGKYLKDRKGRAGFYYVKNVRGQAVVYWKPRGK